MNDRLLTLLLTQAWQILLLAMIVAAATKIVAKNRPHLAHAMWILVLIKCVTPSETSNSVESCRLTPSKLPIDSHGRSFLNETTRFSRRQQHDSHVTFGSSSVMVLTSPVPLFWGGAFV